MKKLVLLTLSTLFVVNFSGCELSGHRDKVQGAWASDCLIRDDNNSYKRYFQFYRGNRGSFSHSTYSGHDCKNENKLVEEEYDTTYHIGKALRYKDDNLLVKEIEVFDACSNVLFAYGTFTLANDTLTIADGVRDGKSTCAIRAFKNSKKVIYHRIPDSK